MVEENRRAGGPNASHHGRPGADEQFLADLERAHNRRELFHQSERHIRLRDIQRNDQWIVHDARIKARTAPGGNKFSNTAAVSNPVYDQDALGLNEYAGLYFTGNIGSTYRIEAVTTLSDSTFWQACRGRL